MRIWIKNPLAVLADDTGGGIVVEDNVIAECLSPGGNPASAVDEIFDASEHVVLPGLINTHHHFYQTLTRAYGPALDKELFDWLKTLYPVWAGLTPEFLDVASRLALAELLLSGCTTAADHHYVFPDGLEDAVDIQAAAAQEMGVWVTLTRGSMNLSVEDGGLPPRSVVQDADVILADSARVIDACHDPSPGAMIQIALAPCSPFSVTREIMMDTAALAADNGVGLHTHLAETENENAFCVEMFGCRPLDYLEQVGWLNTGCGWPMASILHPMKLPGSARQAPVLHIVRGRTCCSRLDCVLRSNWRHRERRSASGSMDRRRKMPPI